MNSRLLIPIILISFALIGVLIAVCGLGLSMGFRRMSMVGFFGAITVLVLLRLIGWLTRTAGDQ